MNLLICLITHNRLDYTKRTLRALYKTAELPYYLIVVDNASTDGTVEYLTNHIRREKIDQIVLNDENLYPGKACNIGWEAGLENFPEATHLMRLDNDMHLEPGWQAAVESYFKAIPELGQLGIDHDALDHPKAALRAYEINGKTINPWPGCVGGPNIIRRKIWDLGVRYQEMKWNDGRNTPLQEDSALSKDIMNRGYLSAHMTDRLAWTFANIENWNEYPDYYKKTLSDRGYYDKLKEAGL